MEAQNYLEQMKNIQKSLIDYLDNERYFDSFYQLYLKFQNHYTTCEKLFIINLIVSIANNYHRSPNFIDKILQIMSKLKSEIRQTLSKSEIFQLFESNKRLLLYFIEESILEVDQTFIENLNESKYWDAQYIKLYNEIEEELEFEQIDSESYEKFRRIGENDQYICSLIRNDSIDEFIIYMNKTNISHSTIIKQSIFETNSFLINKNTSLIEYSAFFGSFQIFKYLQLNNVDLKPSIWLYAIHGNNPEIIHILEENNIEPKDNSYKECFDEAIKCHCNDIALYILNNKMESDFETKLENYSLYYEYHNYYFFDNSFSNMSQLGYLIKYHYDILAIIVLNNKFDNINDRLISYIIYFFKMSFLLRKL